MATGIPYTDELQEISEGLELLYEQASETAPPEIYGAILGWHERLNRLIEQMNLE